MLGARAMSDRDAQDAPPGALPPRVLREEEETVVYSVDAMTSPRVPPDAVERRPEPVRSELDSNEVTYAALPPMAARSELDSNEMTYVDGMLMADPPSQEAIPPRQDAPPARPPQPPGQQPGKQIDTAREFAAVEEPPPLTPPPAVLPVSPPPARPVAEPPVMQPPVMQPPPGAPLAMSPAAMSPPVLPPQVRPQAPVGTSAIFTGAHPAFGAGAGASASGPEPILLPGSIVGRYAIHSHIGTRDTGALYRATEPRIGRDVVLQIWRASTNLPAAASPAGMRFLQHARALAKVTHPHVLALYDVGAVGPSVFITMETFQAPTLDRWLTAAPRKLRKILDVFARAGRGLAAAHAAGVYHRDFRPEHVMVGKAGEVRVFDFGLGRALATAPRTELSVSVRSPSEPGGRTPSEAGAIASMRRRPTSVTDLELGDFGQEGATEIDISLREAMPTELDMDHERVFGTEDDSTERFMRSGDGRSAPPVPLSPYAAPEQYGGGAATGKSDQFALCAALYHAVAGVEPFAGDGPEAILESIRAGRITPPAPGREVPAWLDALLRRGMSAAPEARYESMDALLAELDTGRTRRLRQIRYAAIALAVLGSFGLGAFYALADDGACADSQARMDAVWNEGVVKSMAAAFEASGAPEAQATHTRVVGLLDGYARSWVAMTQDACDDTLERKTQSQAALDDRTQCLSERLLALQALTRALGNATERSVVENAVNAAALLPSVESCAEAGRGTEAAPARPGDVSKGDAETPVPITGLETELADAAAQVDLGQAGRVADAVPKLLERAQASQRPALQARALLLQARALRARGEHGRAEASLRQALPLAEQAKDVDLAAGLWIQLLTSVGMDQGRAREALELRPAAEAAVASARVPAVYEAELLGRLAAVLTQLGRHDEARALIDRVPPLLAKVRGPESIDEIAPLETLGALLQHQGQHREALAPLERALTLTERHFGREHIRQVPVLMALGASHLALGQPESALSSFAHARDIEQAFHGANTARAAEIALAIGRAHYWQGLYEQAVTALERALDIGTKLHGADDPRLVSALRLLAEVRAARGEHDQARELLERALASCERARGAEHPDTLQVRAELGGVLAEIGAADRARTLLEGALTALEGLRGAEHPDLAGALSGLGVLWRQDRGEKRARRYLDRLVAIARTQYGDEHPAVAVAHGQLGEALLLAERPAAAKASFTRARAILEAEGRAPTPTLARVLTGLAMCELATEQAGNAIPLLERALTIHTERPGDPLHLARTRFALARALWSTRADRTRALTLGQQTNKALARLGPRAQSDLAAVKKWLESDGP
jgi:serine/threonine protein kinase/tetratricopeptide (TPR) repeat protein